MYFNLSVNQMYFLFIILSGAIVAFILALFSYFGTKRSPGDSNFMQKFTGIFFVIILIIIIGSLSDAAGCNTEDEPDYPMKYSPD